MSEPSEEAVGTPSSGTPSEGTPSAGVAGRFGSVHPALQTRFCALVGVELPIVQTGMGWVSGAGLTAATSSAGGLGILASATMTLDELGEAVGKVRARTAAPFGVNLLPNQPDAAERIDLMIREGVPVASFAGAPRPEMVTRLNDAGIVTIVTVGARRHAEKMAALGVRCVIAQGGEGGGHTGTVPTTLLLPQVVDAVAGSDTAVLAAGGFSDGRSLVAALAYGADGVAMGTRFLLTAESTVPDAVKEIYLATPVTGTVVSSAIDGSPQRVIRTEMIDSLENSSTLTRLPRALRNALRFRAQTGTSLADLMRTGLAMKRDQDLTWSQLAMAANAPMLTKEAMVNGHPEVGILPTGQVVGLVDSLPSVAELLSEIVTDAGRTLDRLGGPAGRHRQGDSQTPTAIVP